MDVPNWFWRELAASAVWQVVWLIITAVAMSAWKYKEKLGDWYYEAYCLLFNPGKKGRNQTATLTVQVVGRVRSRRNPYTGEFITSRVNFDEE
jgi:hypothetical protein